MYTRVERSSKEFWSKTSNPTSEKACKNLTNTNRSTVGTDKRLASMTTHVFWQYSWYDVDVADLPWVVQPGPQDCIGHCLDGQLKCQMCVFYLFL